MGGVQTTRKDHCRNGSCVSTSGRTRLAEINRHSLRSGLGDLGRCSHRMGAPVDHPSYSKAAKKDRREYRPSPVRRGTWVRRDSNVCMLRLLVPEPTKFDQLPRTLGALQDMQVFWIGEILMMLDMAHALRPSELFCLRWRSFLEVQLLLDIQETLYKGKIRPYGKTKGSITQVPIAEALAKKVVEWREELRKKGKDVSPDAFVFRGRFGGPMDPSNFRKRVLHKLAEELELPKLTFQVIRRTIATLAEGHVKGVQGMMRHSQVSTTTNVYMQILQPEVRSTVDSIHKERSRKTVPATPPEPLVPAVQTADGPMIAEALAASAALSINTADEVAAVPAKPARGVLLEFATKMRQSRGREAALNA